MDAASLLVSVRRRAGISQRELGRRAGTSGPAISAYESGRRIPQVDTLSRILAAADADLILDAHCLPPELNHLISGARFSDVLSFSDALPMVRPTGLMAPVFAGERAEVSRPNRPQVSRR